MWNTTGAERKAWETNEAQGSYLLRKQRFIPEKKADVVCFFIDINQSKHSNHVILESYSKYISSKIIDDFTFKQRIGPKGKQDGKKTIHIQRNKAGVKTNLAEGENVQK